MKIAIIGGGWYGCHIALELLNDGHDVTVYEKKVRLFDGASGNNVYRLHGGCHYPRSTTTRRQTDIGFRRFLHKYPQLVEVIENNFYAVSSRDSLVDFGAFLETTHPEEVFFTGECLGLTNVDGFVRDPEGYLDPNKAREFFADALAGHVAHCRVDLADLQDDLIVNCTYGQFNPPLYGPLQQSDVHYEVCIVWTYLGGDMRGIAIMDGQFASIFPARFDGQLGVTLYSVRDSVKFRTRSIEAARQYNVRDVHVELQRQHAENLMAEFYPAFRSTYKRLGHFVSIRTKVNGVSGDARPFHVERLGKVIHVLGGKISNIFEAADQVRREIA